MSMRIELRSFEQPKAVAGAWGAFLFLAACGAAGLVFPAAEREPGWQFWMVLVGGLFSACALAALAFAVHMTLGVLRFGAVHLYLESEARVGATLRALVRLPAQLAGSAARVRLECHRFTRPQSDGSMQNEAIWSTARLVPIRARRGAGYAEIRIDIPEGRAATDLPAPVRAYRRLEHHGSDALIRKGAVHYDWEIHLHVAVPGVDLHRTYHLQVLPCRPARASP